MRNTYYQTTCFGYAVKPSSFPFFQSIFFSPLWYKKYVMVSNEVCSYTECFKGNVVLRENVPYVKFRSLQKTNTTKSQVKDLQGYWEKNVWRMSLLHLFIPKYILTHCGRMTQICVLTRWNSVHLQVLLSATPQGGKFPEVSQPQALLGSLVSISWKF